jgi:hypothetical protein
MLDAGIGAELARRRRLYPASRIEYPPTVSSYLWSCG